MACQKQWQVACGGLVYFTMFRRPLLSCLNRVWTHIEEFNTSSARFLPIPDDCRLELYRFLSLLPLARLDFRLDVDPMVTCSDASTTGGGVCASIGLTHLGGEVAAGGLRGEVPSGGQGLRVLSVGLFDGIGSLRVALDALGIKVIGHVSVEPNASWSRTILVQSASTKWRMWTKQWFEAGPFSSASVTLCSWGLARPAKGSRGSTLPARAP